MHSLCVPLHIHEVTAPRLEPQSTSGMDAAAPLDKSDFKSMAQRRIHSGEGGEYLREREVCKDYCGFYL